MARMPGAEWQGEHGSRPMLRHDIVCIHTIVGTAPAHAAHFSTHANGRIDQSRDTEFRSAANADGNHRIIAIENEDHGPAFDPWNVKDGHAVPAFTPQQIESIAQICAWAHQTHAIPLVPCPDSRPNSRGIAYHRQGIDGNFADYGFGGRVADGEVWTESPGKVCPGDRRIVQLPKIIARAKEIVEGDMQLTDKVRLKRWQQELFTGAKEVTVGSLLADTAAQARRNRRHLEALEDNVHELARLIAEPLSDADRKQLAAAIAARVVQLRGELSDADDDAEDDLPNTVTG